MTDELWKALIANAAQILTALAAVIAAIAGILAFFDRKEISKKIDISARQNQLDNNGISKQVNDVAHAVNGQTDKLAEQNAHLLTVTGDSKFAQGVKQEKERKESSLS